jgi:hypothetical protein
VSVAQTRFALLGVAGLACALRFTACGGDDSTTGAAGDDDASTPPGGDSGIGPDLDSGKLPEGSVVLPDGAVILPDGAPPKPSYAVLQHHRNPSRDGLYVDPLMTKAAAAAIRRDTAFDGTIAGSVYAQPLYVEDGPGGNEAFVVATEQNHVTALDSAGAVIWDKTFGTPVTGNMPCGNINPLGITGTPYIDATTRTIYFDAMATPDGNTTILHKIYAISLDDGSTKSGWPVDLNTTITGFTSRMQNQRGALQLVGGTLYVPYGGHAGDCNPYRGWVVGVPVANPSSAKGWSTAGERGGIWGVGSLPTDGVSIFASTGNTLNTGGTWGHGEAILRFGAGPSFSDASADFYTPPNWLDLDNGDTDLGGSNAVLFDMPGAPKPHLVLALGKDGNLYLLDRDNLGGEGTELSQTPVANGEMIGAAAVYTTSQGTYVAFRVHDNNTPKGCPPDDAGNVPAGNLGVAKITPGSPPTATVVWCSNESDFGSPIVTTTDGKSDAILWDANDHLYAYDGDTGAKIFSGTSDAGNDGMSNLMRYFNTPINAKGRIAVAVSGKLYTFK